MLYLLREYTAAEGGVILLLLLLIVTVGVFAVKFALDIAVNRKFSTTQVPHTPQEKPSKAHAQPTLYAVESSALQKSKPPVSRKKAPSPKGSQYTLIPDDKIFIVKRSD